jgi:hypothetical protein
MEAHGHCLVRRGRCRGLVGNGQLRKASPPVPVETIDSIKTDVDVIKGGCTAMTTSGASRKASDEPGEAEAKPVRTIPNNEQAVQEEIERTREQVGLTAGQLAAKADVKAQAQAKWTRATERAKGGAASMRAAAAARTESGRAQVAGRSAAARHRAVAAGSTVRGRLQATFAPAWEKAPEPVRQAVAKGASTAKQRRTPLAAAAAVLVAGLFVLLRRWRKQ